MLYGITKYESLKRLVEDNPITIEEIKNYEDKSST